jgi:hypothetical protein
MFISLISGSFNSMVVILTHNTGEREKENEREIVERTKVSNNKTANNKTNA